MSSAPAAKPAGLSVFFPAYNDSGTIASMVIRAVQAAAELTPDYEIIVVNDGSADATPQIVDELAAARRRSVFIAGTAAPSRPDFDRRPKT